MEVFQFKEIFQGKSLTEIKQYSITSSFSTVFCLNHIHGKNYVMIGLCIQIIHLNNIKQLMKRHLGIFVKVCPANLINATSGNANYSQTI